ncbi:VOC family protein [bacterium]|nr:VOC family protein [bacterium]
MLSRIAKVVIFVADMGTMVAFYRDTLGLKVAFPPDQEDLSQEHWVTFGTEGCTLALHTGGQPKTDPAPTSVNFAVDDVPAVRDALVAKGVEMSEVNRPFPGVVFAHGRDPEGNAFQVELRRS